MPAFDALAASVLRGQSAGGARAIDDRQRQLFAARGGHAQFQGSRAALAQPLMSHAKARPRHAGTSFESQASQGAGSGCESQASRDLSTLRARLTAIPYRPATPTNN